MGHTRSSSPRLAWQMVAMLLAALYVVPMFYIVMASLTPDGEAVGALPSHLAFDNYRAAFSSANFGLFLLNSSIVAIASTAIQVILSCAAGYALAKLPVPGRDWIMLLMIALLVIPAEIVMVPLFLMAKSVPLVGGNDLFGAGGKGLIDTLPGLMVPHVISALGIFLMRQFYKGLPDELGDAARVDGASEIRIFLSIYTPLVLPAVAIVAVFAFQGAWNDFLWPLIMTRSNGLQTLQLGLTIFFQEASTRWNLLMVVVLVVSLPVLALFLFAQRFFRPDVMSGAVK